MFSFFLFTNSLQVQLSVYCVMSYLIFYDSMLHRMICSTHLHLLFIHLILCSILFSSSSHSICSELMSLFHGNTVQINISQQIATYHKTHYNAAQHITSHRNAIQCNTTQHNKSHDNKPFVHLCICIANVRICICYN